MQPRHAVAARPLTYSRFLMKIASWNVNSIRARFAHMMDFLQTEKPDVCLVQELKTAIFPEDDIADLGYNIAAFGQKAWNGVAVLSKYPFDEVRRGLTGKDGEQARYIEVSIAYGGTMWHLASFYLPNGNPIDSPKFPFKLEWMEHFAQRVGQLMAREEPFILGGDCNVLDLDDDCEDIHRWGDDALAHPKVRQAYRSIVFSGLTDAVRIFHPQAGVYSFWDYQKGAWDKNDGILIDRLLLSPQAADHLCDAGIVKSMRGRPKASDHVPVWCRINGVST